MTMSADEYAANLSASLDVYQSMLPRSLQSELGVSSLGHCHSEALYRLQGVVPTDAPTARKALHGTAIHTLYAKARAAFDPELLIEPELLITMPSGVVIKGHPDEVGHNEVTDLKTVDAAGDIEILRRKGSTEQQRFQRHVYAFGAIQAGLVDEDCITRNVWVDRAGQQDEPFVEQERFDMSVVHAADAWLTDVLYADKHGEEVPKDQHYDWCKSFCEFFTHCRAGSETADYIVSSPEMVTAAEMLYTARAEAKVAASVEDAAKVTLAVLQESAQGDVAAFVAGDYRVRWTWINSAAASRGGYWKVMVDKAPAQAQAA